MNEKLTSWVRIFIYVSRMGRLTVTNGRGVPGERPSKQPSSKDVLRSCFGRMDADLLQQFCLTPCPLQTEICIHCSRNMSTIITSTHLSTCYYFNSTVTPLRNIMWIDNSFSHKQNKLFVNN